MSESQSQREPACKCGWLDRAPDEPDSPLVFNRVLGEFHLLYGGAQVSGRIKLNYCPVCGQRAPQSRRDALFAPLCDAEMQRIEQLAAGLRTLEEVRARFGEPDDDRMPGVMLREPAGAGRPPSMRRYRTLRYSGISDSLHVFFYERRGSIELIMGGKAPSGSDSAKEPT
jgi:hypothetical protein